MKTLKINAMEIGIGCLAGCLAGYLLAGLVSRSVVIAVVSVGIPLLVFALLRALPPKARDGDASGEHARQLLEASSPMMLATDIDGRMSYVNPAAERLLGLRAADLIGREDLASIFGPGELVRLHEWLRGSGGEGETQALRAAEGLKPAEPRADGELLRETIREVTAHPPSQLHGFDLYLRRADGNTFPATIYLSATRDRNGAAAGLMAVALDQTIPHRQERALRESRERFRDLFENANEMIATLSASGQFLYVNPFWKSCFGMDDATFDALDSFDKVFSPGVREEVAALFQKVLDGAVIERAPIHTVTRDGRTLFLELSMSRRQRQGNPMSVRCMLRDITPQKQRERRLALQLVVSQIVGQSTSPELAANRILESICLSQSWDAALLWVLDEEATRLEMFSAWARAGSGGEEMVQQSMGLSIQRSGPGKPDGAPTSEAELSLPAMVLRSGHAEWMEDLAQTPTSPRVTAARRHRLTTATATPVKVGNHMIAVIEFYSEQRQKEDRETLATIETVSSSVGQLLARSREHDLMEELHRTQQILLDTIDDGICALDRTGVASLVNPAAAKLLRVEAEALTGQDGHQLLHGFDAGAWHCGEECRLRRALESHTAASGETTVVRTDGSSFPAEFALTPVLDQGRYSGSVLSFRDISQRFALDRMKDEFVSTVSHELRTPLTSIRGALGLLSAGLLGEMSDKAANLLRIALSNSDRLVRLINDILDLERIQSGREPLTFRGVALDEIVRQAMDGMQPVAEAARVRLLSDANTVMLTADPDRLLQVITNLLSNAIKFSPEDSTVVVTIREGSAGVTISVIDQGRGIPADKLDTIFDRFKQVDASDARQKGGSGLGLAICRTIVHQHGGRIWAERNQLVGSTFRVMLPFQQDAKADNEPTELLAESRGTILIADGNAQSRALVAQQLRRQGYQVTETATVEETLAALRVDQQQNIMTSRLRAGIEAILVDIGLDRLNGWEILPLLRQEKAVAAIPIVLLSVDHKDPALQLPTGADGWVEHAATDEALLSELTRVLSVPGEKARILVVEDDIDLARVIGAVFARDGIEIKLVHTRQAALEACATFKPQLIVLDLSLPDGDGFNVVDWLRQHDDLSRLPLIVYSAREISPAERPQLELGPTQFLTKAKVGPQQLESLVMTMLRRSRRRDDADLHGLSENDEVSPGAASTM